MISRPWTLAGLSAVYALSLAGEGLGEIAEATGRFRQECDLALWALVGRTPEQALERLNRDAAGEPPAHVPRPSSPTLAAHIEQVHP